MPSATSCKDKKIFYEREHHFFRAAQRKRSALAAKIGGKNNVGFGIAANGVGFHILQMKEKFFSIASVEYEHLEQVKKKNRIL